MNGNESRRVLVVDDNAEDRKLIRRILMQQVARSHSVVEAGTGEAGLEALQKQDFDCVILDFFLGDMDGVEFIERFRERPGGGFLLPIAVVTSEESDEVAARALREGAQDYLVKEGLTASALVRSIENSIEKFRIQQELDESRVAVEMRNHKLEVLRDRLQQKIDELADATQAKDQFMAVMSHEMRTPLNAIIGYADLLDLELDGELSDSQRQYINRIQVGSRHLLDLINDVLDLARADANRLQVDLRAVDLGAVGEEVVALLQSQAREKGIALTLECESSVPHVIADLHRLRQILTNIIGNAIKFTDEGFVRVTCVASGEESVEVRVEDSGIGIDPDLLPLIFSDFYQVRGGLSREKGGSGLGLAISRKLAALMGAEIQAESTIGTGSVFSIILQRAGDGSELRLDDIEARATRAEMPPHQRSEPQRVTVVAFGDDEQTLTGLEDHVNSRVRLLWTTDPFRVAPMVVEEKAALVVLDIASADGAAWRVAQSLQEKPELSNTAVLLLPSIPAAAAAGANEGFDLGWLSLISKPFTAAQLTRAVSTAAVGHEGGADLEGYDVLVVDDDPDSRRVAAKFLSEAQLRVREAPDGESALLEMHRVTPDVVVLDLMMPILDGFGVLATMRGDPVLCGIPVVVLTAKSLTEGERRFLASTAVKVLQKGAHRLADVAALVLRAASQTQRTGKTRLAAPQG
jgi:signal transduction histidine kinase